MIYYEELAHVIIEVKFHDLVSANRKSNKACNIISFIYIFSLRAKDKSYLTKRWTAINGEFSFVLVLLKP